MQTFPYYLTNNVSFDFPSIVTKLSTLNCSINHVNTKYFVAADYVVIKEPKRSIVLPVFFEKGKLFLSSCPFRRYFFPFHFVQTWFSEQNVS